jgi:hypothetical protein
VCTYFARIGIRPSVFANVHTASEKRCEDASHS